MERSVAVLQAVALYYEIRAREFGPTPWGVDWPCELTQKLRFVQLLKVAGRRRRFSLNDLGCGYGALLPFVRERLGGGVDYAGCDIAPTMIEHARRLWADDPLAVFVDGGELPRVADYSVASGLLNVQLGFDDRVWRSFAEHVLGELHRASRLGFAVNFVLPPRPGVHAREGLYRARIATWAGFCRRAFGADIEIVKDYGLREFTLLAKLAR